MKLFVKLRGSGEVKEARNITWDMSALIIDNESGKPLVAQHGVDCDLCDEDGRLLVPQDPDISMNAILVTYMETKGFDISTPVSKVIEKYLTDIELRNVELELYPLARKITYKYHTLQELDRADKLTRKLWELQRKKEQQ